MFTLIKNALIPLNVAEHVIDNYIFDKVIPIIGSVVYCDFIISGSLIQHSGIYIGCDEIVHLNSKGVVEKVSSDEFLSGLGGLMCGSSIYVSCDGVNPVGCDYISSVAESHVGNVYNYGLLKFNCHQFVSGCILGLVIDPDDMEAIDFIHSTLTGVKTNARFNMDSNNWRVWDR
ncbi:hypothetical protein GLP24_00680 [Photobacterium carnosum]|uniref:lecithin retinol acyltransferase family protein n=1 Tax=Photobacterium carnosum TaxID=2023717 RepID=UPI001E4D883A|nr:lecithin retinol acyltransferase family protein [Photobacterium carnosum]MCD9543402.1 hypothetical protein [Photobacterium carnosum]